MSTKHLGPGSVEPPRVKGLLRIFSLSLCPFAKRARLVAKIKNLPHDIVNINLKSKPDWYFQIHPKGQVPALIDGDRIVIESLDIADYLEEKYPTEYPLYPSDPEAKKTDQEIIRKNIDEVVANYNKFSYGNETFTPQQALDLLLPPVQVLEDELAKRGTPFFGGDKPNMIDLMLWPWAEFVPNITVRLNGEKLPLKDDQLINLKKWVKSMLEVPVIKELYVPPHVIRYVVEARKNDTLDFDDKKLFE